MGAVIAGDKIQVSNVSGIEGGIETTQTGIGYGSGGKAPVPVGVVWSSRKEVLLGEIAVIVFQAIDHGRVTLESDTLLEPVVK